MSIRRTELNQEIAVLRGQINLLHSQDTITEETSDLLWDQVRKIIVCKTQIEGDYYDMCNTLEQHEKNKETALSALREIAKEDTTAGFAARNAINAITGD